MVEASCRTLLVSTLKNTSPARRANSNPAAAAQRLNRKNVLPRHLHRRVIFFVSLMIQVAGRYAVQWNGRDGKIFAFQVARIITED